MFANGRRLQGAAAAFDLPGFCRRYSIGRVKAYEEINAGRLKAVKVGGRTLIRKADGDAWLASLPALKTRAA